MARRVSIAVLCAVALWLAAPAAALAAPADDLADRVDKLEAQRGSRLAEKAALEAKLSSHNGEVAALKRKRSSWRRDRDLKKALKRSRAIADELSALDKRIRAIDGKLKTARKALVKAIDVEIATQRDVARRTKLVRLRQSTVARLKPKSRKIVLPNDAIDPLADETELREQAALIDKAMKQLEREEKLLSDREDRYDKMAQLQKSRARADEAALFDDNRPRRTTSRQAGPDNRGANEADNADFGGAPEPQDDSDPGLAGDGEAPPAEPGFDSDPAVVLVEVVDADTIDALRQAQRSDDPKVKAKAARRARDQVQVRRERLERQRKKIEARIRAMKSK